MKRQFIPKKSGLNLNKQTISNLGTPEMNEIVGGQHTYTCQMTDRCTHQCATQQGHTCNGNNC